MGGGGPSSSRVSFLRLQFGRRWSIVLQGFIFVITVGEEVAPPPTWFLFYIYSLGTLVLLIQGFLFVFTVGKAVALLIQGFLFVITVVELVAPPPPGFLFFYSWGGSGPPHTGFPFCVYSCVAGGPSSSRVSLFFTVGEEVALVLQGFLFVFTVGEAVAPPRAFLRLWMQQLSVRPVTWSLG